MKVLVAYATEYGSTREVAVYLAKRLQLRDIEAQLYDVNVLTEPDALTGFDAFVIGSAIHDRQWLQPATGFVMRYAAAISSKPHWLFSVGLPASLVSPLDRWAMSEEKTALEPVLNELQPTDTRLFSGVILKEHIPSSFGEAVFKLLGGRYGDYRDWDAVAAWGDAIAESLSKTS